MKRVLSIALCAALLGLLPAAGHSQSRPAEVIGSATQTLQLEVSKGNLIRLEKPAGTAFIADPNIADIQVKSSRLVYIFGKKPGETTFFAVDENEQMLANFRVVVTHNLSRVRSSLRTVVPDGAINVDSVEGAVVLSGNVATPVEADDARRIAATLLPADETVLNRMQVAGSSQINLRVRVAEVNRQVIKQIGFNWDAVFNNGTFLLGLAQGAPLATRRIPPLTTPAASNFNNLFGGYNTNNFSTNALIDALETEGLVTILAEPNLTALSGETASFLAGGEFPIPVAQRENVITVEFKSFGVSLTFVPTVLNDGRISIRVRPEVSQVSPNLSVQFRDIVVPGIVVRRAETTVELASGQSFALAGLLQNNIQHDIARFPGLGDIPILGALFRSDRFRRDESELVIIATPYLVRPVSVANRLMAPTEGLVPASDQERLKQGLSGHPTLRDRASTPVGQEGRGLVGPSGFVVD